jgi:hypothetical protein
MSRLIWLVARFAGKDSRRVAPRMTIGGAVWTETIFEAQLWKLYDFQFFLPFWARIMTQKGSFYIAGFLK